jgi:cytochrome c551/c552
MNFENNIVYIQRILLFIVLITIVLSIIFAFSYREIEQPKPEIFYCGVTDYENYIIDSSIVINEKGKTLFEDNCKSCHAVHTKEVGPALKDVTKRRSNKWLKKFIRNSSKLVGKGDKIAVKLFKEYNNAVMTSFPTLTDKEIDAILEYVEQDGCGGRFVVP